jgi:hypothetical protein
MHLFLSRARRVLGLAPLRPRSFGFAALAERERRIIGERTRLALAAAKARRVKLGGLNRQSVENCEAALKRAETLRPL